MSRHAPLRRCSNFIRAISPILMVGALVPALAVAGPAQTGSWSTVYAWPDVAIHLSVLPDGNVLTYADDDNPNYLINGTRLAGSTKTYVVNLPINGVPGNIWDLPQTRTNMFCSGHTFLTDGRVLVIGGHLGRDGWGEPRCEIFDYHAYGWQAAPDMYEGRWYPSGCMLGNGEVLAISGTMDTLNTSASIPEIWSPITQVWRQLPNANKVLPYYPFTILAPNGKVFVGGPAADTYYLDCTGLGAWTFVGNHVQSSILRDYGSAVQYGDGKILVMGGSDPPTNTCETIDLTQNSPHWSSAASMTFARRQMNATLLPDGTVLATGGTSGSGFNNNTGAVLTPELWSGSTWAQMSNMAVPRLYHSTAALLPDGRVLSAGSGRPLASNGGADQWNAEIYSPPYLFKGARPTITSAPVVINNGVAFNILTPDAASITQVTLVKLSSVTHAFNQSQRFNRLTFSVGTGQLTATAPSSTSLAPSGHYMLFLINSTGIPSVAKIVQLVPPGPVAVEDPATTLLDFMALRTENPMTHGQARIAFSLSHTEPGRLDVLDVAGRLVKTLDQGYYEAGREKVVEWDGTDASGAKVPSGVYWYRLRTPTLTRTGKLALLAR
jgi:hypothetical protein